MGTRTTQITLMVGIYSRNRSLTMGIVAQWNVKHECTYQSTKEFMNKGIRRIGEK